MTDFEVIFVDDHSTDERQQIIEQQSNLDNRFKILKMPQKGGNAVKGIKYGLPYCKGKFFFYMSQDDFIDSDALEKLVKTVEMKDADALLFQIWSDFSMEVKTINEPYLPIT